jgi:hypothetical protein
MNFDPYSSSYARHVSGKWLQPPVVRVGHGVDREFHYWKDVVEHLAPAWAKAGGAHISEVPEVVEQGWLTAEESMDETWLRYVVTQKSHGVALAEAAHREIEKADNVLSEADHEQLHRYFDRTLLTARLYRASAAAYWGFRVWARGDDHRSPYVFDTTREGLLEMREIAEAIENYPVPPAEGGQWSWQSDAAMARKYWQWIVKEGWPAERAPGQHYSMAGLRFPICCGESGRSEIHLAP